MLCTMPFASTEQSVGAQLGKAAAHKQAVLRDQIGTADPFQEASDQNLGCGDRRYGLAFIAAVFSIISLYFGSAKNEIGSMDLL